MQRVELKNKSLYADCTVVLTTKHAKSSVIALPFLEKLGAHVVEHVVDTDKLGTFSGEVAREGNALDCALRKCEWSFDKLGSKVEFALASEGSFGPHPFIPFLACDHEILYFIDRKRGFHLHRSHLSEKTNFRAASIDSIEELQDFAKLALFPSHALIIRPNNKQEQAPLFKGIVTEDALQQAFWESSKCSSDKKVWVETDMRAQFNPSRRAVIAELAAMLAAQLQAQCPRCASPGWGVVRQQKGLICSGCSAETELIKSEVRGCVICDFEENSPRADGREAADPENCQQCNP